MGNKYIQRKENLGQINNKISSSSEENTSLIQLFSSIGNQNSVEFLGMDNNTNNTNSLKEMEGLFNTDFSNVNIHKNSSLASNINALAFTQGNDIHFASGEYNPSTVKGKHLLGHELTHVVQQRSGNVNPTGEINGLPVNDNPSLEREADINGARVIQGYNINSNNSFSNKESNVIQGTFRASARILANPQTDSEYSAAELVVPRVQFSERDRPDTHLEGSKQGKHVTAWTFMMRFWENYFTGNLKDVFKKLYNEFTLLEYLEGESRDKITVLNNFFNNSNTNPYIVKHDVGDWVTILNMMIEHFADTYQESKLTVKPGKSTYRGEGHAKRNLDDYESNIDLYDEVPKFDDVKTQIYKFIDVSSTASAETRKLAYRNVFMGIKNSWPGIFKYYSKNIRELFESDLDDIKDTKLSFDYMFPRW